MQSCLPGGMAMAKMLSDFQEHGKAMIGKDVKRVFVMLDVCDLVDNSVRRLKTLTADLSNALWAHHREIG